MNAITQILSILSDGKFHSGEELGKQLEISRAAVWKRIRSLGRYGIVIYSIKGKGYRLSKPLEFLEREKILSLIDDNTNKILTALTVHQSIDSTNQYLLNRSNKPDFHAHVVLAEFQTAGRGRRGHGWISPYASGIIMSVGWHFETTPELLTGISLGSGIAVMRTLNRIGIRDAGLKWPNDIFWQDRKLGGSLVELRAESAGPCNVVIGIGINYSFPLLESDPVDQPWTDLGSILQKPVSRNFITAILISELFRVLTLMQDGNTGNIVDEWRKYDIMKGKQATLLLPDTTVRGQLLGIDETGALLMSVDGRTRKFNSGEISLRVQH